MNKEEIAYKKLEVSKILLINNVPIEQAKIIGAFIENLELALTDYKERNENAIEYIKDRIYIPTEEDDVWFEQFISLSDKELDDLLEILDKEK